MNEGWSVMPHQPKVLVVDDDANIISAFQQFLTGEHCTVISALGAEEALSVLSQTTVSLVITDVRMPWQSGVTLLMKVKQSNPALPVIVITGYPGLVSEGDARQYGADYYFVKPLELNEIRNAVRKCLNRATSTRKF